MIVKDNIITGYTPLEHDYVRVHFIDASGIRRTRTSKTYWDDTEGHWFIKLWGTEFSVDIGEE